MNIPITKKDGKFYYCLILDKKAVLVITSDSPIEGSDLVPADFRIKKGDEVTILEGNAIYIRTLSEALFLHFRYNGTEEISADRFSYLLDNMPPTWFKRNNLLIVKSWEDAQNIFLKYFYHYWSLLDKSVMPVKKLAI